MVDSFNTVGFDKILSSGGSIGGAKNAGKVGDGQDFKDLLMQSIDEVNRLTGESEKATVDLATGKTDNVAEVFTAVKKAEMAFHTLMQMRNTLMDAYDEIKQMRV